MSCTYNTFTRCILKTIPANAESLSPQQSGQEYIGKSWDSVETGRARHQLGKHEGLIGRSRPEVRKPSKNVHEAWKGAGPCASRVKVIGTALRTGCKCLEMATTTQFLACIGYDK